MMLSNKTGKKRTRTNYIPAHLDLVTCSSPSRVSNQVVTDVATTSAVGRDAIAAQSQNVSHGTMYARNALRNRVASAAVQLECQQIESQSGTVSLASGLADNADEDFEVLRLKILAQQRERQHVSLMFHLVKSLVCFYQRAGCSRLP